MSLERPQLHLDRLVFFPGHHDDLEEPGLGDLELVDRSALEQHARVRLRRLDLVRDVTVEVGGRPLLEGLELAAEQAGTDAAESLHFVTAGRELHGPPDRETDPIGAGPTGSIAGGLHELDVAVDALQVAGAQLEVGADDRLLGLVFDGR